MSTHPGPWPTCPTCGSTRSRCQRPSGHDAPEWHAARTALWESLPEGERARLARIVERPRVRVIVGPGSDPGHPRYAVWCEHCTHTYANFAKTDVEDDAKRHRGLHRTGAIEVTR
jgi:hypothetical protein